ncbi:MAG: hypothetical protein KDK39_10650 [Leptospiraceae bacterium]|nr:hypothetical protein [Leptospiraceae bacterium]
MGVWLPIVLYLGFLLASMLLLNQRFQSDQHYFLANRQIPALWAIVSVVATESSVATILVFPQAGYQTGLALIPLCLGFIGGRLFVAYFFLPALYGSSQLSIYASMSSASRLARISLSLVYLIAKFLSSGVRFFMGGLALQILFGQMGLQSPVLATSAWILGLAAVAGAYSLSGGLKAVILTDQLQGYVILFMGVVLLATVWPVGGAASFLPSPSAWLDWKFNWHNALYAPVLFAGAFVLSIGSHGCDQDMLQRILATRDLKAARYSLAWSGLAASIVIVLYLLIGMGLGQQATDMQGLYPVIDFVRSHPNPWLQGSFAVLLLAAAMSTLDSALHSTGLIWKDIFPSQRPGRFYAALSLILLVLTALGFAWQSNRDFLSLAMGTMNYVNGALIAITSLFIFKRQRLATKTILTALAAGFGTTLAANSIPCALDPISGKALYLGWTWVTILSTAAALMAALMAQFTERSPLITQLAQK